MLNRLLCDYMNSTVITLVLTCIFSILPPSSKYAITSAGTMSKATSGRSLNVVLQPTPNPVVKGTQTNFKVTFDQNGGNAVQPHIDYDLTISKDGKQVFQASALAGHPNKPLHTAEGIVTIPSSYKQGAYMMNITGFSSIQ